MVEALLPALSGSGAIPRLGLGSPSAGITLSVTGAKTQLKWDIKEDDFLSTALRDSRGMHLRQVIGVCCCCFGR